MIQYKLTGDIDLLNGQQYVARTIARQWDFIRAMTLTNTGRDLAKAFNSRRKTKGVRLSKSQKAKVTRATKKNLVAVVGVGGGNRRKSSNYKVKTIRRSDVGRVIQAEEYYGNALFEPKLPNRKNLRGLFVRKSSRRLKIQRIYRIVERQKFISTKPSLLLFALAKQVIPRRLPVNLKIATAYAERTGGGPRKRRN